MPSIYIFFHCPKFHYWTSIQCISFASLKYIVWFQKIEGNMFKEATARVLSFRSFQGIRTFEGFDNNLWFQGFLGEDTTLKHLQYLCKRGELVSYDRLFPIILTFWAVDQYLHWKTYRIAKQDPSHSFQPILLYLLEQYYLETILLVFLLVISYLYFQTLHHWQAQDLPRLEIPVVRRQVRQKAVRIKILPRLYSELALRVYFESYNQGMSFVEVYPK